MTRYSRSHMGCLAREERLRTNPAEPFLRRLGSELGPLSDMICSGGPYLMKRSTWTANTSSERKRRRGTIAGHSRLNSSTMFSMRHFLPFPVMPSTKLWLQRWLDCSGRSQKQEPSLSHNPRGLG